MNVNVQLRSIRCRRTTYELGTDEIYYVVFVNAIRRGQNGNLEPAGDKPAYGYVSPVMKMGKDELWYMDKVESIELPDDTAFYQVTIGLYEMDGGFARDEMVEELNGLIELNRLDLSSFQLPKDPLDPLDCFKTLVKWSKALYKHFDQDDLLGSNMLQLTPHDHNIGGVSQWTVRRYRGKYDVGFEVFEGG